MALMPKRVKYRKSQRGRMKGNATRCNYVAFGEYGLQVLETSWITAKNIEAGRVAATHFLHREGKVYIRIFRAGVLGRQSPTGSGMFRDRRCQRGRGPAGIGPGRPQNADPLSVRQAKTFAVKEVER